MVNSNQKSKREGRRRREEGGGRGRRRGGGHGHRHTDATSRNCWGPDIHWHMRVHRQPRSPLRSLQQYLDYIHSIVNLYISSSVR